MPRTRTPRLLSGRRDPPGADTQLERGTVAGQAGEEVDRRIDDRRVVHRGRVGVVGRGDPLVEDDLGHHRTVAGPGPGTRAN